MRATSSVAMVMRSQRGEGARSIVRPVQARPVSVTVSLPPGSLTITCFALKSPSSRPLGAST